YAKKGEESHSDSHLILLRLSEIMKAYMSEEEEILFPFIKRLASDKKYLAQDEEIGSSEIIVMMQHGYKEVRQIRVTLRELSDDYRVSTGASAAYQQFYKNLAALDSGLHQHIYLEDDILFPKATAAYNEL